MASSTVGIGLTIGAVAQGSVGSALGATRRGLDGLTRSSRALELAQQRVGRSLKTGLASQQASYDRLGRALTRVRTAQDRLAQATARSNAAIAAGKQSWGQLAGTAMAAWGTIQSIVATAGQAASFADTLRETRIKGRLSAEQETALGEAIRVNVSTTNQSRDDLALGAHQLITGGAGVEEVTAQLGLMGTVMTALRTSSEHTTGAMLALRDMGVTDRDGMQGGIERLIAIGERGSFTPDMMVQAFAQLGDVIKTTGLKGDTAIAELAAGLQVAEGSMGAANAQAGLQSWLTSLHDVKIADAYERAGVDYQTSMADLQKTGLSEYQASLELAGAFIRDRLSGQDQQALLTGDDDGRINSMLSEMGLGEVFKDANAARFALSIHQSRDAYKEMTGASGEGSLQALADLRKESPLEQMKALKNSVSELAVDIGTALLPSIVGITNALTPMVAGIAEFVRAHPGVVTAIGAIVAGVVGWRVATVAGTFTWRQVMIVWTQGAKALHILRAGMALAQARMALLRSGTLLARGGLLTKLGTVRALSGALAGRLVTGLRVATKAVWGLGRAMLMNPIGIAVAAIAGAAYLIYKYWEPISGFFSRLWEGVKVAFSAAWEAITGIFSSIWDTITTAFDGGIAGVSALIVDWSPLGLFYKAFAGVMDWFGIDLPDSFSEFGSGLIEGLLSGLSAAWEGVSGFFSSAWDGVTGIFSRAWEGIKTRTSRDWQTASGLFSRAWDGVSGFFGNAWDTLSGAFDGGIAGISRRIADWSPLESFYNAFSSVMEWFGIDLPDSFSDFGRQIIDGLVGGITGAFGKAKEAIVGIGESVTGWFRDTLGINSPSRVFAELGAGIPEGAAKGITGAQGLVRQAALGMATATAVTLAAPAFAVPDAPAIPPPPPAPVQDSSRTAGLAGSGGIVIHFSPTINVQGANGVQGLGETLATASDELKQQFERLMRDYELRKRRLSYDPIGVA